jgi:hypothetical protein
VERLFPYKVWKFTFRTGFFKEKSVSEPLVVIVFSNKRRIKLFQSDLLFKELCIVSLIDKEFLSGGNCALSKEQLI